MHILFYFFQLLLTGQKALARKCVLCHQYSRLQSERSILFSKCLAKCTAQRGVTDGYTRNELMSVIGYT